ncbi:DNA-methyltransferase [Kribbella qitaiheensis]|uniref:DNA-methyltransferase n=1 Tax=Kribbella qitaiheensis TaxID=1544730 RepID=UPI00362065C2
MSVHYADDQVTLHHGDALDILRTLPDGSVNSCVTSPPYFGLRDYGEPGQYGLEASPAEYVETMRALFAEVRRVLADDGTLWLNLGDSYSVRWASQRDSGRRGLNGDDDTRDRSGAIRHAIAEKNLLGIPWRVAFALQDDGWILRNAVVWHKPNAMPESVTDRLSTRYESVLLFSKSRRYWFDLDAIREPHGDERHRSGVGKLRGAEAKAAAFDEHRGLTADNSYHADGRNPGDVWTIATRPFSEAHFAVMPPELAERCILAGCKPGGTVLDPFSGSGTTGMVAQRHGRKYVGIDLNADYLDLSLRTRLQQAALDFTEETAS